MILTKTEYTVHQKWDGNEPVVIVDQDTAAVPGKETFHWFIDRRKPAGHEGTRWTTSAVSH